ncbi:MAG: FAD binding domain-containing protein [Geminicoccaceae bacterium]|nr:FAD binding domain-containing protein [Geminicoccaceae bacterium]
MIRDAGRYARPSTLDDALGLLGEGGWRPVAGATDIYPAHVTGLPGGGWLDLSGLRDLAGIRVEDEGIRIGALATWSDLAGAGLPPAYRALTQAAGQIGGRQIQNTATVCGNVVNASPAADGAPPLLVHDAEVELRSVSARRRMPLADFLIGNRRTVLRPGELVTSLILPAAAAASRSLFLKLGARSHLVISISMVALRMEADPGDGSCGRCAIAVGACAPTARRLPALEERLTSLRRAEVDDFRVAPGDLDGLAPIDDIRATAAYRLEATARLIERGLARLAAETAS